MNRNTLSRLPFLLAAVLAASVTPAIGAASSADAEQAIRQALAQWVDAANRGDAAAALSVWAPDMIGWAPRGPDDSYGSEAAAARDAPKSTSPNVHYVLKIDEVIVDGALAVVRDTWTQTVSTAAGPKSESFRSFEVWRRQRDGAWKISRWIDGPIQDAPRAP